MVDTEHVFLVRLSLFVDFRFVVRWFCESRRTPGFGSSLRLAFLLASSLVSSLHSRWFSFTFPITTVWLTERR